MLKKSYEEEKQKQKDLQELTGLNFGYGLAFTHTNTTQIDEVEIRDETVRVTKSRQARASFMLETHKLFNSNRLTKLAGGTQAGWGFFAATRLADSNGGDPFTAFGLGMMAGFKNKTGNGSWNVGLGLYVDTQLTQLRSDIKDGEVTTETDPQKLLVESDEQGVLLMISSSW